MGKARLARTPPTTPTDIPTTIAAVLCIPRIAARSVMIKLMPLPRSKEPITPNTSATLFVLCLYFTLAIFAFCWRFVSKMLFCKNVKLTFFPSYVKIEKIKKDGYL